MNATSHNFNEFNLYYYIKKEYRRKGYALEALKAFLGVIKTRGIVLYGEYNLQYIYEENKPKITLIRIEVDEGNEASFKVAKRLGFEYDGKVKTLKSMRDKDYIGVNHVFTLGLI